MERLGTEAAFEVLARARELEKRGHSILHFEMGEPEWAAPPQVIELGAHSLRQGRTRYTQAAGEPALRHAIAEEIARSRGVAVTPEEIVVVPGAKPILFFAALALIDEGDEVLLPDPGFPIFESMVRFAGGKPVYLPLREPLGFRPDPADWRRLWGPRTKAVILNSPHNPTGGALERNDLEALAAAARAFPETWILSDEIYSRMRFDGKPHLSPISMPELRERTVLVDGFSKSYSMTGWRLGYGAMPKPLAEAVARLVINSFSCVPAFVQDAGLAALHGPSDLLRARLEELRRRRDRLVAGLNSLPGFRCAAPAGSLYAFPNVEGTGSSEEALQRHLLEEAGVACVAGTAFGPGGKGHLRFSLTEPISKIDLAVERMRRHLG